MFLTGFLTAGVSFAVYLHGLKTRTEEMARTQAFAVLVFAELLRDFGARSETEPIWRLSLLTNFNLASSFPFLPAFRCGAITTQRWAVVLKTSFMSLADCLLLLAVGAVTLLFLEVVKVARHARPQWRTGP